MAAKRSVHEHVLVCAGLARAGELLTVQLTLLGPLLHLGEAGLSATYNPSEAMETRELGMPKIM